MSFQDIIFLRSLPLNDLARRLPLTGLHKPTSTAEEQFALGDASSMKYSNNTARQCALDELRHDFLDPKVAALIYKD
jgi:hypothetical protein